jgi:hypothetical protein
VRIIKYGVFNSEKIIYHAQNAAKLPAVPGARGTRPIYPTELINRAKEKPVKGASS